MSVDLKGFALTMIELTSDMADLDGGEVQDMMIKHGLLVETTFDPEKHSDPWGDADEGDAWYEVAPELRKPKEEK